MTFVPLTFAHIGASGSVSFASGGGREDILELNGTNNSDTFNVNSPADQIQILDQASSFVTVTLNTGGIDVLKLRGLGGDDTFNLFGTLPYAGGTLVDGGDPSASDIVNLIGATAAVTVSLGDSTAIPPTDTTITGYGGTVTLTGVEVANLDANGHAMTVKGTAGRTTRSRIHQRVPMPARSRTRASIPSDQLHQRDRRRRSLHHQRQRRQRPVDRQRHAGRRDHHRQRRDGDGGRCRIEDGQLLRTSAFLQIDALAGNDTINVTPSATVPIFVDGGDPIGSTPGDPIVLHPPGAFAIEPGPQNDQGGMNAGRRAARQLDPHRGRDDRRPVVPGPALVLGTNGEDEITIIARDSSYNALADGVQDFTVAVNAGPDMLFINVAESVRRCHGRRRRYRGAGAGPEQRGLERASVRCRRHAGRRDRRLGRRTRGGNPRHADRFLHSRTDAGNDSCPGGRHCSNHAGIDTAILNDTTNTSTITATPFTITALSYTSSPGGVEQVEYQGLGGNDALTVVTPAGGNTVTYTPGAAVDSAAVQVGNLVPLNFLGLGAGGSVTMADAGGLRVDTLVYNGTAANDTFNVAATSGGVVTLNSQLAVNTPGVANLTLNGLAGDNTFSLQGRCRTPRPPSAATRL